MEIEHGPLCWPTMSASISCWVQFTGSLQEHSSTTIWGMGLFAGLQCQPQSAAGCSLLEVSRNIHPLLSEGWASLLAYNVNLNQLLGAVYWKSPGTFIHYYLRDGPLCWPTMSTSISCWVQFTGSLQEHSSTIIWGMGLFAGLQCQPQSAVGCSLLEVSRNIHPLLFEGWASLLAYNVSLSQLLGVAYWKSPGTFTHYYLRDVSRPREVGSKGIGSTMVAQQSICPPTPIPLLLPPPPAPLPVPLLLPTLPDTKQVRPPS